MHRHDRAGEPGGDEIVQDFRSDLSAFAAGADHGHDAGLEEWPHRGCRGDSGPRRGAVQRMLGDGERENHVADATFDGHGLCEARIAEDVEHAPVVADHVGIERIDPFVDGRFG